MPGTLPQHNSDSAWHIKGTHGLRRAIDERSVAGGFVGLVIAGVSLPDLTWLIFLLLGGLVVAQLAPLGSTAPALACALGLSGGFANGSSRSFAKATISLIGMVATVFVVTALAAAAVIAVTWPPAKIAVRVLDSWTAATGLLLLGWSLR